MNIAYLSIGSNLGNREENIVNAITKIEEFVGEILSVSSVYETEPWGFDTHDKFLNIILKVDTDLSPEGLLGRVYMIEKSMGRERSFSRYSSRNIDVDIIFFNNEIIDEDGLVIPHPLMYKRRFVLVPLNEISPDMVHPVLKQSVASLLRKCDDVCNVILYKRTI
jgi:2-amino-4-hydroxy-6-hydroxymethyldihydropteridine diphosphokinase